MLTPTAHDSFQKCGFVHCPGFLPEDKLVRAQAAIWQQLEKMGIWQTETGYLPKPMPTAIPDVAKHLRKVFKNHPALIDLVADEIPQIVDEFLDGRITHPMMPYPQLLFTMPNAITWTVPHNAWHLDMPRLAEPGISGVQIFTFLERVTPSGGGTLVVAGSHHFFNEKREIRSQQLKRRLKRIPYFQTLMTEQSVDRNHFMTTPAMIDDVEVQVVELHGEPGDVYFTDLRLLHTTAPNATATPRIMLTQRFLLEKTCKAIYGTPFPDHIAKNQSHENPL